MRSKQLTLWFGLVLLAAAATTLAGPCGVLPEGPARIDIDGRQMSLEAPARIPCAGRLRLLQGTAVLAYAKRSNVNEYRPLKRGEPVDLSSIATESAVSVSLDRVLAFFQGDRRIEAVTAMSRSKERLAGFPYDDVLLPKDGMQLRVLEARGKGTRIREFVLHLRGLPEQILVRAERESEVVAVPAAALAEGQEYGWLARLTDDQAFSGKFRTLTRDEARRVEQQLDAISRDDALSESTRLTLAAIAFDQNRLLWNRDVALAGLLVDGGKQP